VLDRAQRLEHSMEAFGFGGGVGEVIEAGLDLLDLAPDQ
jgi:hypothetical protein